MAEDKNLVIVHNKEIQSMIYTFRGRQVMLDSDLARLYQVTTGRLNEQVKRNIDRFPVQFMFQLTAEEYQSLISQNAISNKGRGGRRKLPYVFTEQGIAMLSAVLNSAIAVDMSIKIMNSFVEMRRFILTNQELFAKINKVELRQLEFEKKSELRQIRIEEKFETKSTEIDKQFEEVFDYIATTKEVKQKIFFNGQIYDAFSLMVEIVEKAREEFILIDNYVDVNTLNILSKKRKEVDVLIVTSGKGNLTEKDIAKFNSQYPKLMVKINKDFHDRFIIIDRKEVYHIGASIKDAGKKSFGITKLEVEDLTKSLLDKVL